MSTPGSFSVNNQESQPDHDETDQMKEEQGKKQPQVQRSVPLLKLFTFADSYDYVLMFLGSIGACLHGASVPVFFIYFGKLINIIGLASLFPKAAAPKVAKVRIRAKFSFNITLH